MTYNLRWIWILSLLSIAGVNSEGFYPNQRTHEVYDYVVVGGGSTGSVIASRLSENKGVTVLLLEAGGPPSSLTDIPYFVEEVLGNNETDWNYYTEPQEYSCFGLKDKKSFWTRYKGLGGCSAHNYMVYTRGAHRDYDTWAENGATGWSWKDVLPFFKKSEENTNPDLVSNGFHGTDGYLTVSVPSYKNRLREAYLKAGSQLGYDIVDYNGPTQTGFSEIQLTQRDGRRCSTEKGFLRPARERPNLDILIYAQAIKIEFDLPDKRARRVIYEQNGQTKAVTARREIVLSAGAIGSPQLLMLSGIGLKEHLQELEIPVIADLHVGLNLQDHLIAGGMHWLLNDSVGLVYSRDFKHDAVAEFIDGKGPFTSAGGMEIMVFMNTKFENSTDWPDMQIEIGSTVMISSLPEYADRDVTTILPILMRPKSRGYLKLRSRNPHDHPIIEPRYFSEEEDLLTLVEGMKFGRKIIETPALQKFGPKPIMKEVTGCEDFDWKSDEYLTCVARTLTYTDFHPCCTVKMGDPADPSTVLDPELRVKGVKGLRVADASVMPDIVTGNTNAPCIMIGEKAAHMIKSAAGDTTCNI